MSAKTDTFELQVDFAAHVLGGLSLGIIVVDAQQRVILWNTWMERVSGFAKADVIERSLIDIFPDIAGGRLDYAVRTALESGLPSLLSNSLNKSPLPLYLDFPGERRVMQQTIQVIPLELPNARCCVVQILDVTAARAREDMIRKQARDLSDVQQRQSALLHSIPDVAWLKDINGRYLAVNDRFSRVFGLRADEVTGKRDEEIYPAALAEQNQQSDRRVIETGTVKRYDESITMPNGELTWVETIKVPIFNDDSEVIGIAGVARDITERKATEERIHFLAHYDTLTELPNRFMLFEHLEDILVGARRAEDSIALLFIDLDRFKIINDSLGHTVGDQVLRAVAERLKEISREVDIIARVGGDEFVVALTGVKKSSDVDVIARKIVNAVARPYSIESHEMHITPSIGISMFPRDGNDIATLVKNADRAMYRVKQVGRNGYEFFTEEMNSLAVDRLTLESGLRYALERNELELLYQSQIDLETGQIVGAEAQLRWNHPELGLITPDRFISIAEETGLIIPIGEWVIAMACAQNRQWQQRGLPLIPIAVNISAVQLRQKHFVEVVMRILEETAIDPRYLDLEITESVIMHNAESTISMLDELKAIGVKLAVDDFGTGYSSLSYLKRFPIDSLKIDRSFVRDITTDPNDAAITGAIIAIARQLNLTVVAEGVETLAQLQFLRLQRCDQIQGFYFSKPLSADDFALHLSKGISGRHFEPALSPA